MQHNQEAGDIFSQKYCSWFVKLFVGQPRLHKVKLINIQHSCPQTNKPLDTQYRITNKTKKHSKIILCSCQQRNKPLIPIDTLWRITNKLIFKFMMYIRSWKLDSRHMFSAMRPQPYWLKKPIRNFFFDQKLRLFKIIKFWKGFRLFCNIKICENAQNGWETNSDFWGGFIIFVSNIHLCLMWSLNHNLLQYNALCTVSYITLFFMQYILLVAPFSWILL